VFLIAYLRGGRTRPPVARVAPNEVSTDLLALGATAHEGAGARSVPAL
jgi:hypothetical protein